MKKMLGPILLALALFAGPACTPVPAASWAGVDETVIEKFAEQAGRQARDPFINTDQGDLLLFVFLLAGIAGGFVAGYYYRALFPPKRREDREPGGGSEPAAASCRPPAP
jgi:hypothetical protein